MVHFGCRGIWSAGDEYFTRSDSSGTATLLGDALGSTVGLVGSSGTIATSYTYQPFGATTVSGASNSNSYQFTGYLLLYSNDLSPTGNPSLARVDRRHREDSAYA